MLLFILIFKSVSFRCELLWMESGFLSGSTGVLGVVAAAEERPEDAKFHACVGADDSYCTDLRIFPDYG